jgi:SanA protein
MRRRFPNCFGCSGCGCWLLLILISIPLLPFGLRAYTAWAYADDIYSVQKVPSQRVAIIFGARIYSNTRLSPMLRDRVATGADLYFADKVDVLLMSGDGRDQYYNEPGAMRRYAIQLGVPEDAILLDAAGLRTYDSCQRAEDVYNLDSAILVTQAFHLDRALLLCNSLGVESDGVAADYHHPNGYGGRGERWSHWREIGATTLAFMDLYLP